MAGILKPKKGLNAPQTPAGSLHRRIARTGPDTS